MHKVYRHKETGSRVNLICQAICTGTNAECVVVESVFIADADMLVMTKTFFESWYEEVKPQQPMYSLDNANLGGPRG